MNSKRVAEVLAYIVVTALVLVFMVGVWRLLIWIWP